MASSFLTCPRCYQSVNAAALVGQWHCRVHPGILRIPPGYHHATWSCCGLAPDLADADQLLPADMRGCTPLDHAAPAGAASLALVPEYMLTSHRLVHPRAESRIGGTLVRTDAPADVVVTWTAGGQPHARPLRADLTTLAARVAGDPGYWASLPPAQASGALDTAARHAATRWREDMPASARVWRAHTQLPPPADDGSEMAATVSSRSDAPLPPWAHAVWLVVPDVGADPRAGLAPILPVWVVQRAAPAPDPRAVARIAAHMRTRV
jgi:hypothetical protein